MGPCSSWRAVLLLALVLASFAQRARAEQARAEASALGLREVLAAVREHHPELLAGAASVRAVDAETLAARGEFDPLLRTELRVGAAGYYDPQRIDVIVEQPTTLFGSSLYAGYRLGRGAIAPYYGEQRTLAAGELRAGARVPLLSRRRTDERRTSLTTAKLGQRSAEAMLSARALELERDAASKYFAWVAAGARLRVQDRLLTLATERDLQVRSKVELGALPALERVDNQRSILERERQRVAAARALERAALELSLYLRDERGSPRVATVEKLPEQLARSVRPSPNREALSELALARRPELALMHAESEGLLAERALAREGLLPRLDILAEVSRDLPVGRDQSDATLAPTVVEVGASFSLPLGLRKARGKLRASDEKLTMQALKARLVRDKVVAEVRDASSQFEAANRRLELAEQAATLAAELAAGERERFWLGATTLLFVNVREQAAADAELAIVDAWLEVEVAWARLLAAAGSSLEPLSE